MISRYFKNLPSFLHSVVLFTLFASITACTNSREALSENVENTESTANTNGNVQYERVSDIPGAYYVKSSSEVRAEKQALRRQLNQELDEVDLKIEAVEDKAKTASASAKQNYESLVDELDEERERLVQEYEKIEDAADSDWNEVKSEVQEVINNVEQSVDSLLSDVDL